MKSLPFLLASIAFGLSGCDQAGPGPQVRPLPPGAPTGSPAGLAPAAPPAEPSPTRAASPSHRSEVRPVAELEQVLNAPGLRSKEARRALMELCTHRTPESCRVISNAVSAALQKLPNPPLELAKLEEEEKKGMADPNYDPPLRVQVTILSEGLRYLVLFDLPDADAAAGKILERFERDQGNSEFGRIMLKGLRTEIHLAKKGRETGITPWQIDMRQAP